MSVMIRATRNFIINKVHTIKLLNFVLILILLSCFPFIVARSAPTTGGNIVYRTVYGTVVDINGRLLNDVKVTVYDTSGSFVTETQTFSGAFAVSLSSGTYRLQLDKKGYESKTITFSVSTSSINLGTITLGYSLKLSVALTYLTVNCLSEVSIPISISNIGSQDETANILVDAPEGWNAGVYSEQAMVNQLTLSPNSVQNLVLKVETPYNVSGLYNVTVMASGFSVQNKTISFYVNKVEPQILVSKYPTTQATQGSPVSFDLTISNVLGQRFTGLVSIKLPNGWIGNIAKGDGSPLYGISLGANEFVNAVVSLYVPANESPGDYNITVFLKAQTQDLKYVESSLPLHVVVLEGEPILKLATNTPYLDAYAGNTVTYSIGLENIGAADGIVSINVTGLPSGYNWITKDTSGNVLSKLYLKAGESKTLNIVINVPPLAEPNIIPFTLKAYAGSSFDQLNLSLGILGWYKLSYVTQNFYVESTAGAPTVFQVEIQNTGYSSLSNLKLQVTDVPNGFTVSVDPSVVLLLKPQETATFSLSVTTDSDISAGDYYLTLNLMSDQSQVPTRSLHVYVKQSSEVVYIGAILLLALVGILLIVYRKYGRR